MALALVPPALAQQKIGSGAAPPLVPYRVENDRITTSLTGVQGDADRGAVIFVSRQTSTCLLCHADPAVLPQSAPPQSAPPQSPSLQSPSLQSAGTIGPSLADVGSRLKAGQIRLRIVDAARVNPNTVMPSFYVTAGLHRVGRQWQGKPILDAAQIEDLVAFLVTSRSQ